MVTTRLVSVLRQNAVASIAILVVACTLVAAPIQNATASTKCGIVEKLTITIHRHASCSTARQVVRAFFNTAGAGAVEHAYYSVGIDEWRCELGAGYIFCRQHNGRDQIEALSLPPAPIRYRLCNHPNTTYYPRLRAQGFVPPR